MTLAHTNVSSASGTLQVLLRVGRDFAAKRAQRRAYRQTQIELSMLSDSTLKDLGLTRASINRAALNATIGSSR